MTVQKLYSFQSEHMARWPVQVVAEPLGGPLPSWRVTGGWGDQTLSCLLFLEANLHEIHHGTVPRPMMTELSESQICMTTAGDVCRLALVLPGWAVAS